VTSHRAPGLVIAAPKSSSGKTTVMLGLLRAFSRRGLAVQGLKCGPDYIDPAFHAAACGKPSLNLDGWAMSPSLVKDLASEVTADAALVLCEGLMGLFDGVPAPDGRSGSSADIAAALGWPVLLVIDVSGQSQSAGAVALGCATFDPRIHIAGVILNKVGSERHRRLVTTAMEKAGIKVLGSLPRDAEASIPERHLGLVQAEETDGLDQILNRMADLIEAHVDLNAVQLAARPSPRRTAGSVTALPAPGRRIALARDAAFSFIYPHHIQAWTKAGAEIVPFSPLANEVPPHDCDVCWLPGGYPELHAETLSRATRFLDGLRKFSETKPVHGECGGYMTLGKTLTDANGIDWPMAGLLSVKTSFAKRKMTLGYRDAVIQSDTILGPKGTRLRGHEFHYATIFDQGEDLPLALVVDAYGSAPSASGSRRGFVTGSFFHAIASVEAEETA
jgi:cobyrinic acid a,c-diamide synthase